MYGGGLRPVANFERLLGLYEGSIRFFVFVRASGQSEAERVERRKARSEEEMKVFVGWFGLLCSGRSVDG